MQSIRNRGYSTQERRSLSAPRSLHYHSPSQDHARHVYTHTRTDTLTDTHTNTQNDLVDYEGTHFDDYDDGLFHAERETEPVAERERERDRERIRLSVCVRMRPLIQEDHKLANAKRHGPEVCVHLKSDGQTVRLLQDAYHSKSFQVDHTFDATAGQAAVYSVSLQPIVRDVLRGYNGTCMVYGQTASGKTFTMFGDEQRMGIAHCAVREIFESAQRDFEERNLVAKVFVSFYQIYLENVYDLLGEPGVRFEKERAMGTGAVSESARLSLDVKHQNTLPSLNVREDSQRGAFVENLHCLHAKDSETAFALIQFGLQRRRVHSTAYNIQSSRSHAILQIHCDFEEPAGGVESGVSTATDAQHRFLVRRRTLTLVDLAGSERVQTFRQSSKRQLQEAAVINKSIAALGNCIYALSNRERQGDRDAHVPYRDCKLTRLLADSLGGNNKTSIICTISPCMYNFEETLSTLKFASRARVIKKVVKKARTEEVSVANSVPHFTPFQHDDQEENAEFNVLHEDEVYEDEIGRDFQEDSPVDRLLEEFGYGERIGHYRDPPNTPRSYATIPTPIPQSHAAQQHRKPPLFPGMPQNEHAMPSKLLQTPTGEQFTLRDFLRACTVATKLAHPNENVSFDLPDGSSPSKNAEAKANENESTPTKRRKSLFIQTDPEPITPRPGYSSIPSRVEVVDETVEADDDSQCGAPPTPLTEPVLVRRPSVSSTSTGMSTVVESYAHTPVPVRMHANVVPCTPRPESPSDTASVVSMVSSTPSRISRQRHHKGVQTWNMAPAVERKEFNGSLDDFGNYVHAKKVDQTTEIDTEALIDSMPGMHLTEHEREQIIKLTKLSPFELAVVVLQLQESLHKAQESNRLLQEVILDKPLPLASMSMDALASPLHNISHDH